MNLKNIKRSSGQRFKKTFLFEDLKVFFILLIITVAISLFFFFSMLYHTHGNLSCPLDDSFIFFQYAKMIAEGEFLRYQPHQQPSTGATSFLYILILSPFFLIGIDELKIIPYVFILGCLSLFFSSFFIYKLLKKFWDNWKFSLFGSLLFIFHGPTVWGYLSGMEIWLFCLLSILSFYFFLSEETKKIPIKTTIFLSLLALTRPEGFIICVCVFSLSLISLFLKKVQPQRVLILFIPLFVWFLQGLLFFALTGHFSSNTLRSKSILYFENRDFLSSLAYFCNYLFCVLKGVFCGFDNEYTKFINANTPYGTLYLGPFSFLFFIIGILPASFKEFLSKKPSFFSLIGLSFFSILCAISYTLPVNWHWYRYLIPLYWLLIMGIVFGIKKISEVLKESYSFYAINLFFTFSHLLSLLYFGVAYGKNCKDIYYQHIKMAQWMKENIPEDALVAINDIGAIAYLSEKKILDLCGLCTNELSEISHSPTSIFEYIEDLKQKPDYFVIYPDWFDFPKYSFIKEEIYRRALFSVTMAGSGHPKIVYKADFSRLKDSERPFTKWVIETIKDKRLIDQIDICNLKDEKKHNYKAYQLEYDVYSTNKELLELECFESEGKLIEGGRIISDCEVFYIENVNPDKDLYLVMRTCRPFSINLYVNDTYVGIFLPRQLIENRWYEEIYKISNEFLKTQRVKIKLQVAGGYGYLYSNYRLWFYQ